MANKVIDSLTFGSDNFTITTPYSGTCVTEADVAEKVVTCANFLSLETGARITVTFGFANTASSPTLNVNSTGAKAIKYRNTTLGSSHYWKAFDTLTFVYDSTCWRIEGHIDTDTVYTHPSYTAKTGKPTANQTLAFGGTATVSQIISDATGHVTDAYDRTITIPSTLSNGTGTAGLIKTSSTVTSSSGYTACPVISGVPYYKDTNTVYTHPSYTAKSSGLYKVTVDSTGHVSAATAVTKADITALGIPGSDTNTTYSNATTSAAGLMSAADKTKLDRFTYDFDIPKLTMDGGAAQVIMNDDCVELHGASGVYANGQEVAVKSDIPDIPDGASWLILNDYGDVLRIAQNSSSDDYVEIDFDGESIDIAAYNDITIASAEGDIYLNSSTAYYGGAEIATVDDIPDYITTGAKSGTTIGSCATIEGQNNTGSASQAHAEGYSTTASGAQSHAEGIFTTASGAYSHASGCYSQATSEASTAMGYYAIAGRYQTAIGRYNTAYDGPTGSSDTTGSVFIVGCGTNSSATKNAFRITTAGKCMGTAAYVASGADYAEYYEWLDGNPENEDRRGYFVTLEGTKIRKATAEDDYILGVVSATPFIIGNGYTDEWQGMYLKDVFGENLTETVDVPETVEGDNVIPAHTETRFIVNPDYDHTQKYIGRHERQEWTTVGTHGQLVVVDDGTCEVNHYCKVAANGAATKAEGKTEYRVTERLDETHIRIVIK